MSRKILHFHIPKAAGTALRTYLIDQRGNANVSEGLAGQRLRDALLQWDHMQIISGHFAVHQGDRLPRDRLNITVLRHPVDRLLSDFFFQKNNNSMRLLDARHRIDDLDAYIEHLRGFETGNAALQMNMLYPLGTQLEARIALDARLAAAKTALDEFDLVGLQEDLEDFTCMIAAKMEWPARALKRENVTLQRISVDQLDPLQRQRISALLEADIDLYAYARQRFEHDRRRFIMSAPSEQVSAADRALETTDTSSGEITATVAKNFGDKRCEILRVDVRGDLSESSDVLSGEPVKIAVEFAVRTMQCPVNIGIAIRDERDALVFGTNSMLLGHQHTVDTGRFVGTFSFLNRIGPGYYSIDVALTEGLSHHEGCYHWLSHAGKFQVYDSLVGYFEGRVMLDADVWVEPLDSTSTLQRETAQPETMRVRSFGRINTPLRDFSATIELLTSPEMLPSSADSILPVRIHNIGGETWPCSGRAHQVCLSYRWYVDDGSILVEDGIRSNLPCDVTPGSATIVSLNVRTPNATGNYLLAISLVQEGVAWFMEECADSVRFAYLTLR